MDTEPNNLGDVFDKHIEFEFDKEDVMSPLLNPFFRPSD
jgi:hypothetical protein